MLRKALDIALLYLRQTFTSTSVIISALLVPLLFTYVIAQSMGGSEGSFKPWRIGVVDEDGGPLAVALLNRLADERVLAMEPMDRDEALAALADDTLPAAIVLPAGYAEALRAGATAEVTILLATGSEQVGQIAQQAVQGAGSELAASVDAAEVALLAGRLLGTVSVAEEGEQQAYYEEAFSLAEARWQAGPPIAVASAPAADTVPVETLIPRGVGQSAPGMLVMFTLFMTIGGGISLLVERDEGTLRRLLVMPVSKSTILLGKLLGIFLAGLVQIAFLILAGRFLFGVSWGNEPVALILLVVSLAVAATSLGILVAALSRTASQANALSTIVVMAISALGGAWWPLEIVPPVMQQIGHLFPTAWAMDGFNDIITRGLGLEAVLPEIGILLAYAVLFFAVGIWRFRYE